MPRCVICDCSNDAPSLSTTRDAVPPIRWKDNFPGFICDACWDEEEDLDSLEYDEAWEGEDFVYDPIPNMEE